jgi:arylsulfatase A-like enzyme
MPRRRNAIVILVDSLRYDFVGFNGNLWIRTPCLDALARRATVFDRAIVGSYPCLPCRREIWTGRYEFPFRGWGPLERDDVIFPELVRSAGYTTMFITDNYLLCYEDGNYQRGYNWDLIRGQEHDDWITDPTLPIVLPCQPHKLRDPHGRVRQYLRNTASWRIEEDHFAPQVMRRAADWLERNRALDGFLLWVDCFDPHEPWDPPYPYDRLYNPGYDGERVFYPMYGRADALSGAELTECRALYAGEVTMVDRWLGRLMEKVDELDLLRNTLVAIITDHGYMFGEHGLLGKPWAALAESNLYREVARLPWMLLHPGGAGAGRRIQALVQPVDLCATLLEWLEVPIPAGVHSKSLLPLLDGRAERIREYAFWGRFGEAMHVGDGEWEAFFWPAGAPYRDRLYHVAVDPAEADDRSDTDLHEVRRLRAAAEAWLRDLGGPDLRHRPFVRDHV